MVAAPPTTVVAVLAAATVPPATTAPVAELVEFFSVAKNSVLLGFFDFEEGLFLFLSAFNAKEKLCLPERNENPDEQVHIRKDNTKKKKTCVIDSVQLLDHQ